MFADPDYFGSYSLNPDGYLESPTEAVLPTNLDYTLLDLPLWPDTTLIDDESTPPPETPPLSRSSSLNSSDTSSPEVAIVPLRIATKKADRFEITWPDEGQINTKTIKLVTLKRATSITESLASLSTVSSPVSTLPDPHHEGSCSRCRLTEAEARKCRLDRRREQNRASQRKFRARKEAKIKEAASQVATLEQYVEFLEKHNNDLEVTNADLRQKLTMFENSQRSQSISTNLTSSPNHIQTLDWSLAVP